ncbi:hypothetical protein EDEG_02758 [Edhazardia aedis USNM 41457]|uniref:Uncharacterized protein n=1 Tax=Edhazardia aedis (strain USNM 41457) TaxID=1003232 RepID=J8ZT77_EDHAE|nr:hypothetical protein EDEG_02758 [Edhazardia aedis USNM 41457]|eukprot:EJW02878.1 hypothetical protein EDEG_02758 [Edhazardia aedis USNM 41457]
MLGCTFLEEFTALFFDDADRQVPKNTPRDIILPGVKVRKKLPVLMPFLWYLTVQPSKHRPCTTLNFSEQTTNHISCSALFTGVFLTYVLILFSFHHHFLKSDIFLSVSSFIVNLLDDSLFCCLTGNLSFTSEFIAFELITMWIPFRKFLVLNTIF